MKISSRLAHLYTPSAILDVCPSSTKTAYALSTLNPIKHCPPPSPSSPLRLFKKFSIFLRDLSLHTDIDPCILNETDPPNPFATTRVIERRKRGKGEGRRRGGSIMDDFFLPRDTLHRFISSKRETSGETVQFESDVGCTRLLRLG